MFLKLRSALFILVLAGSLAAADDETSAISLTELAAKSDLVALVQARDTDYFTRRDIPVSGSAYLRVLIPYKADRALDLVEVYEKGLHPGECYFPNPTVFEEGRRYLLFVRRDPGGPERYRGHPEGCALDVLVSRDNRYALRYPPRGVHLTDDLATLARAMEFADAYAVVKDEDLPPGERNELLVGGYIEAFEDGAWRYTTGVELGAVRRLIDPEALEH